MTNLPNTAVRAGIAIIVLLAVAACEQTASSDNPVQEASRLLAGGDAEGATLLLRKAMRSAPNDAELRFLLAKAYLDLGQGSLAIKTLDQSLQRGLPLVRSVVPRAAALFVDDRYDDVIAIKELPEMAVIDVARLRHLQAKSRRALSPSTDGQDAALAQAYLSLIDFVATHLDTPGMPAIENQLLDERVQMLEVERAWQHFACRTATAAEKRWEPLARPEGRLLRVGPSRAFKTVADAANAALDGDTVEIDGGVYEGDVVLWPQNNLLVRGAGERPMITAAGRSVEGRDVWLFTGNDVVVENVEISGARSAHENGAGIRHTGIGLTLRHVYLHDNENGLLTGNGHPESNRILIEYSEFARNGDKRGYAHNIYVGRSKYFEMRYSYSHASFGGHLVKTRAAKNVISYNRLTDGESGYSSYIVDIPEGGFALIVGNEIGQGTGTLNHGMISFAGEEVRHADSRLIVQNNSFYNRDFEGIAVRNHKDLELVLMNNLFGGAPMIKTDGVAEELNNLAQAEHGMVDPRNHEFGLVPGAAAVDFGADTEFQPEYEYVHPAMARSRLTVWRTDSGAHERCGL